MAIEAASAARSGPDVSGASCAAMQIGRHHRERNRKFREIRGDSFGQELLTEFLGVDLRSVAERSGEKIGERARARRDEPAHCFAAVVREADDVAANILAANPCRIGGADQRADRGAGDGDRLHAHLVERFDHRDMRQPTRTAATEREREGLHRCRGLKPPPLGGRIPRRWRQAAARARI